MCVGGGYFLNAPYRIIIRFSYVTLFPLSDRSPPPSNSKVSQAKRTREGEIPCREGEQGRSELGLGGKKTVLIYIKKRRKKRVFIYLLYGDLVIRKNRLYPANLSVGTSVKPENDLTGNGKEIVGYYKTQRKITEVYSLILYAKCRIFIIWITCFNSQRFCLLISSDVL